MRVVYVPGACVGEGAWWWHRMVEPLRAHGLRSMPTELTSAGRGPVGDLGDFHDDVSAVRPVLETDEEPAIVVAHGYGGMVVTEAAAGVTSVRHLVYLTSVMPEPGDTLGALSPPGPAPWMDVRGDGTVAPLERTAAALLLQDCDDRALVNDAVHRLVPQALSVYVQSPVRTAWKDVPATYVVCTEDRVSPVAWQREQASRADRTVELPAGHHAFLSHPRLLAGLLAEIAAEFADG